MPKIEIDEEELRQLRGATALFDQLQNSPKTRREFQRSVKVLHPDTITDDDRLADAPEIKELKELRAEFSDYVKSQKERAQDDTLNAEYKRLREDDNWTEDGIEALKKFQLDRHIPSPLDAAARFTQLHPPTEMPASGLFQSTSFGFGQKTDDPDTKLLFEDEDAYAEREFVKVMNSPG